MTSDTLFKFWPAGRSVRLEPKWLRSVSPRSLKPRQKPFIETTTQQPSAFRIYSYVLFAFFIDFCATHRKQPADQSESLRNHVGMAGMAGMAGCWLVAWLAGWSVGLVGWLAAKKGKNKEKSRNKYMEIYTHAHSKEIQHPAT